jgi:HEPN domain-containing protein
MQEKMNPDKITLWDRARADLSVAKMIMASESADETQIDIAAYHVQQAIEKSLKFMLNNAGRPHPRTHDIYVLSQQLEKYKFVVPEWILQNADVLNEYDTRTRYGARLVASRAKVDDLLELTITLIDDLEPKPTRNRGEYSPSNYF